MLFEVSRDCTDRYVLRNLRLDGISSNMIGKLGDSYYKTDDMGTAVVDIVLFEDNGRFDLGICSRDNDITWICKNFNIPVAITSDLDFIYGLLIYWLMG